MNNINECIHGFPTYQCGVCSYDISPNDEEYYDEYSNDEEYYMPIELDTLFNDLDEG